MSGLRESLETYVSELEAQHRLKAAVPIGEVIATLTRFLGREESRASERRERIVERFAVKLIDSGGYNIWLSEERREVFALARDCADDLIAELDKEGS